MVKWENAELVEISICKTANGGDPSQNFDQQWFDKNGSLVVSFS